MAKRKIFLHIGLPKTGTTYLQCQFETNRQLMEDHGIFVPNTGQLVGRDHNLLALSLQPSRWSQFPDSITKTLHNIWSDLLEEIDESESSAILITSEAFSWELNIRALVEKVFQKLNAFSVTIILTTRDKHDFILSMYHHLIRMGRYEYSLENMFNEFSAQWEAEFYQELWGSVFGVENLILIDYEEIKGDTIHEKFLNKVFPNHNIPFCQFKNPEMLNRNISATQRFLDFLEELRRSGLSTDGFEAEFKKVAETIKPIDEWRVTKTDVIRELNSWLDSDGQPMSGKVVIESDENIRNNKHLALSLHSQNMLNSTLSILKTLDTRSQTILFENQKLYDLVNQIIQQNREDEFSKLRKTSKAQLSLSNLLSHSSQKKIMPLSFFCSSENPIASNSFDHINPLSTQQGLSRNPAFVAECLKIFGPEMTALDIGTGTGGLVAEFLSCNVSAFGIDGSDHNQKFGNGYWHLIPGNLSCADATKRFSISSSINGAVQKFDLITMWEFLEHIEEESLEGVFENIRSHLDVDGYVLCSVSTIDHIGEDGTNYHRTLKPKNWWLELFDSHGFKIEEDHYPFSPQKFCRGNGPRFEDPHNYQKNPNEGFWITAKLKS